MNRILITIIVVIHLIASIWHGSGHSALGITLPPSKNIFIYVVILFAPVVSAGLVWTRYFSIGLWVFTLAMIGSFLFGAYHHYVLISPDNIGHLPAGSLASQSQFINSAAVIALLELAGALYGMFCLGSQHAKSRGRA